MAVLAVVLAAYALDCSAAVTPEQAMQCCTSMPCSSPGHHGQDCCKMMPAMRAPFLQPSNVHGSLYSPLVVAVLATINEAQDTASFDRAIVEHSHAPPIGYFAALPPLRI